ncbi:hypothetical protein [Paractinoplanes hotanensis]|uniref:Uncharacterized protein n=1 Tax=Paractinoplanes hotanensis TaxID=2906497 RepID=A0ABT0YFG5_9ACTN|nr:hypothetical protein [Actinoplanes hotanensis]MCM4084805.1 hypothetical protein [Actinoplanes hotanensis]
MTTSSVVGQDDEPTTVAGITWLSVRLLAVVDVDDPIVPSQALEITLEW